MRKGKFLYVLADGDWTFGKIIKDLKLDKNLHLLYDIAHMKKNLPKRVDGILKEFNGESEGWIGNLNRGKLITYIQLGFQKCTDFFQYDNRSIELYDKINNNIHQHFNNIKQHCYSNHENCLSNRCMQSKILRTCKNFNDDKLDKLCNATFN